MYYDVMLRFEERHPALEQSLAANGYEIVIPRMLRAAGRDTSRFQVPLPTKPVGDDYGALVDEVFRVLLSLQPLLEATTSSEQPFVAMVDLGVKHDPSLFVQDFRFPHTFLALLARLSLNLNISVYV